MRFAIDIVEERLGDSVALLAPATGAIVLTNAFGQAILAGLRDGATPAQIAQAVADHPSEQDAALGAVNQVLDMWRQAGLLIPDAPEFPDPVDHVPVTGAELCFAGNGGAVRCQIPDPVLAEQIHTILSHMEAPDTPCPTLLEAIPDADGFAIFRDGRALSGRISLDAARFVLLREIAEQVCGWPDVAAVFHAGAVAQNGQALVICGDSGQGKSTLTFGLVAAGYAYLGDDHIPLHRAGRRIMAFPTAAGIKPGSWDLPEIRALQDRYGLTLRSPREGVRYLPLHLAEAPDAGAVHPVRALIFPEFRPGNPFEMTRLGPEQALIEALQAGSRLSGSHVRDIAPLADLLNHVPAYRLRYASSEQSVPACLDLLNSPLP